MRLEVRILTPTIPPHPAQIYMVHQTRTLHHTPTTRLHLQPRLNFTIHLHLEYLLRL